MQEIPCASIWTLNCQVLGLKQSLQSIWCGIKKLSLLFYSKFIFVSPLSIFPQKHEFYYYTHLQWISRGITPILY